MYDTVYIYIYRERGIYIYIYIYRHFLCRVHLMYTDFFGVLLLQLHTVDRKIFALKINFRVILRRSVVTQHIVRIFFHGSRKVQTECR